MRPLVTIPTYLLPLTNPFVLQPPQSLPLTTIQTNLHITLRLQSMTSESTPSVIAEVKVGHMLEVASVQQVSTLMLAKYDSW